MSGLWQMKEWRWDRLLEHLRREGWGRQLWGTTRPAVLAAYVVTAGMLGGRAGQWPAAIALCVLAAMTLAQIGWQRQRRPVFTRKAVTVTATAGILTALAATLLTLQRQEHALPFLILLPPVALACAWVLWYPVDAFLKRRIIDRARRLREAHRDLTVIGVTGSVGKTTTKELLACVLADLHPLITPAHVNSEIGVAQWLTSVLNPSPPLPELVPSGDEGQWERGGGACPASERSDWCGVSLLIVELGAYRRGEIALMCSYVQPTIGVITHVGTQHVALFGSPENLFQAKAELIRSLPVDGRAFLNGDNDLCRAMKPLSPAPVTIVGTGGPCDLEAYAIEETTAGIRFTALETVIDVPLHGTHNVRNVLLALAVGAHLGVRPERMRELLRSFRPLAGTFQIRTESGVRLVDDTHNSSAASVKAAIAWARNQPEAEKTLLCAGLIEMGEYQENAERELGALASEVFTRIIVIDPQSARNVAMGAGKNIEMLRAASARVPPGSLLVCAGRMPSSTIQHLLPG